MDKKEFSLIRSRLGKTQNQLAHLLGTSLKALQSFEQGWRDISTHSERQLLFLLTLKGSHRKRHTACWVMRKCPVEVKRNCPAREFQAGHLCWFIKIASENPFLWTGMKDASAESRKMCYMKLHDYPKSCSRCL
jgi:hypothetical protein